MLMVRDKTTPAGEENAEETPAPGEGVALEGGFYIFRSILKNLK